MASDPLKFHNDYYKSLWYGTPVSGSYASQLAHYHSTTYK